MSKFDKVQLADSLFACLRYLDSYKDENHIGERGAKYLSQGQWPLLSGIFMCNYWLKQVRTTSDKKESYICQRLDGLN